MAVVASQIAQTLRALNSPVRTDFNGQQPCSAVPFMRLRSPTLAPRTSLPSSFQFLQGSQFLKLQASSLRMSDPRRASTVVRCEQSTEEGSSLSIWFGRIAMLSFAAAITVEITTGKGLLQNIGLTTPLPTAALALTVVAGLLTAYFIFESGSND